MNICITDQKSLTLLMTHDIKKEPHFTVFPLQELSGIWYQTSKCVTAL